MDRDQAFCLAQNIWFEAAPKDNLDRLSVAHVVMNRVEDSRFPKDACSVVWQNRQFSWTRDGKSDKIIPVVREDYVLEWVEVVNIAVDVLAGRTEDPTKGATHYHAYYVSPVWATDMELVHITWGHIFYRRN